jgi:hypothetical protein
MRPTVITATLLCLAVGLPGSNAHAQRTRRTRRRALRFNIASRNRTAEAEGKQIEPCPLVANDRLPLLGKLREGLASIVPCGRFYVQRRRRL